MSKYTPVTIFDNCPDCQRLLRLTVMASWSDFLPEQFCCPYCGTRLKFSGTGKLNAC